jgi:signal recognition particle subunit SRP9
VLKVTDDKTVSFPSLSTRARPLKPDKRNQCLKFKTRSSVYLNRFELFTRELMMLGMGLKPRRVAPAVVATPAGTDKTAEGGSGKEGAAEEAATGEGGAAAGKSKKKKKGKKK